ncbi:MAG: adenylyltransferase/cytidyltransferase family protein [Promethearchaeota archaeon]
MNNKKILVAGTFDILHPGHIFLINEAAKLGEVHVIIATDENRERYSGKPPIIPEEQRLEVIKNLKNVKEVVLGRKDKNILLTVLEINPDIILLGPDQRFDEKILKETLKSKGLSQIDVRRLNIYYDKYELNSSSRIKRRIIKRENGYNKHEKVDIKYLLNS